MGFKIAEGTVVGITCIPKQKSFGIWEREVLERLTYELRSGIHGYNEAKLMMIEELPDQDECGWPRIGER
jgi:hypothetical protein